jgi:hypothetical protein
MRRYSLQEAQAIWIGISGQGFYSIMIPDIEKADKFGGLISMIEGDAT